MSMSELERALAEYSDGELLDQYFNHKNEYTPEALDIMRHEVARRNLNEENLKTLLPRQTSGEVEVGEGGSILHYNTGDFESFDHVFTHTDVLLAHAVLRDNKVPFYVDNPGSTDTLPIQSEAETRYTIHVHKQYVQKAHEILDEHFVKENGVYAFRHSSVKDRLKAFNFHDLHLTELEAKEEIEVTIPGEEKAAIVRYAKRLLEEADKVETEQERVLFYYDILEPLIGRLETGTQTVSLSRTALLAVLEVFQVYCGDPEFPGTLDPTIGILLGFFLG
jgi:hypothetical protein